MYIDKLAGPGGFKFSKNSFTKRRAKVSALSKFSMKFSDSVEVIEVAKSEI